MEPTHSDNHNTVVVSCFWRSPAPSRVDVGERHFFCSGEETVKE